MAGSGGARVHLNRRVVFRELLPGVEHRAPHAQHLADGVVFLFSNTVRVAGVDAALLDES
jgi:hypothetical protein